MFAFLMTLSLSVIQLKYFSYVMLNLRGKKAQQSFRPSSLHILLIPLQKYYPVFCHAIDRTGVQMVTYKFYTDLSSPSTPLFPPHNRLQRPFCSRIHILPFWVPSPYQSVHTFKVFNKSLSIKFFNMVNTAYQYHVKCHILCRKMFLIPICLLNMPLLRLNRTMNLGHVIFFII